MKPSVYIGLGSNLAEPRRQVEQALRALAALPHSEFVNQSRLYRSPALLAPENPDPQPDYINAVAHLRTTLGPHELLAQLQALEQAQGRQRGPLRWSARTLDLDLLLYGDVQLRTAALTLPHPRLHERAFVLYPLRDCNPDLHLPDGRSLNALCAACPAPELQPL